MHRVAGVPAVQLRLRVALAQVAARAEGAAAQRTEVLLPCRPSMLPIDNDLNFHLGGGCPGSTFTLSPDICDRPGRRFVAAVLDRMVRLSYYDNVIQKTDKVRLS